jgi:hypothetical protein
MKLTPTLVGLVALAPALSAQQNPALFKKSAAPYGQFAYDVEPFGDHDGDGKADLLVGVPSSYASFPGQGHVQILSGVDGRPLLTTTDFDERWSFGASVVATGDVDADGITDFAVAAPKRTGLAAINSRVGVYSGATGARVWMFEEPTPDEQFGRDMDSVGDQNGDGVRDLIVGSPNASSGAAYGGAVTVLSGVDGALIRRIAGTVANEEMGRALSRLGDFDGDGVEDFLVGVPGAAGVAGVRGGAIRVLSGATGAVLQSILGRTNGYNIGASCDAVGDVDGDGVVDFVMHSGNSNLTFPFERISVVSSRTVEVLLSVPAPTSGFLSRGAVGVGDANGDGRPDIAYAVTSWVGEYTRVRVVDARTGTLIVESANVLASLGGAIQILARAGDLNGDGLDDVACALPQFSRHAPQAGALLTFFGAQ